MKTHRLLCAIALASLAAACGVNHEPTTPADTTESPLVFTMTNATTGNTLSEYLRSPDGTLVNVSSLPTGGTGVGHGLENQGALTLSRNGRFVYVVNPGSNDLSVFQVTGTNVRLTDRVPSGGTLPVSVAEWNGVVYVLNRNGDSGPDSGPTIQGFRVSSSGILSAIPGSQITLHPTSTNAAQIGISPDGLWIAVTERGLDQIDVIPLSDAYTPGVPVTVPSAGRAPFGFAFSDALRLYIAESAAGTTSAYDIDAQGNLSVLSAALSTEQRAICWLAISPDNKWVYVANTASRSISSYRIMEDGSLTLLASVAVSTAGPPVDLVVDTTGDHLSVLTTVGSIETFLIDRDLGSLAPIQTISGLPAGTNGLTGS